MIWLAPLWLVHILRDRTEPDALSSHALSVQALSFQAWLLHVLLPSALSSEVLLIKALAMDLQRVMTQYNAVWIAFF